MIKPLKTGRIRAVLRQFYEVIDDEKVVWHCVTKGKGKLDLCVGDIVDFKITCEPSYDPNFPPPTALQKEGRIENLQERRNLLHRSDQFKSKLFASNLDQMFLMVAPEPSCYPALIARAVIASRYTKIPLKFIVNKCDLSADETLKPRFDYLMETIKPFVNGQDISIVQTQSLEKVQGIKELFPYFKDNQTSLIFGQSGVGKSTLLNALIPDLALQTATLSSTLDSGKHTTTTTKSYELPHFENCIVLDSPGFQEFGLAHLTDKDIWNVLTELHSEETCKFKNCKHINEPQCAVLSENFKSSVPYFDLFYQLYLTLLRERKIEELY